MLQYFYLAQEHNAVPGQGSHSDRPIQSPAHFTLAHSASHIHFVRWELFSVITSAGLLYWIFGPSHLKGLCHDSAHVWALTVAICFWNNWKRVRCTQGNLHNSRFIVREVGVVFVRFYICPWFNSTFTLIQQRYKEHSSWTTSLKIARTIVSTFW